jgi:hypothetical protein
MMLVECGEWGMEEDEAVLEILNAERGEWAAVSNGYKMFKLAWFVMLLRCCLSTVAINSGKQTIF